MQAGREVRVMVAPNQLSDDDAALLSHEIAREIEREVEYPGSDQGDGDPREPRGRHREVAPVEPRLRPAARRGSARTHSSEVESAWRRRLGSFGRSPGASIPAQSSTPADAPRRAPRPAARRRPRTARCRGARTAPASAPRRPRGGAAWRAMSSGSKTSSRRSLAVGRRPAQRLHRAHPGHRLAHAVARA